MGHLAHSRAGVVGAVLVLTMCGGAWADIAGPPQIFSGKDLGAGPLAPRPNSDAAAHSFLQAAATLGQTTRLDFEAYAAGRASMLQLPGGAGTATFFNTGGAGDPEVDDTGDVFEGFNTTPGGSKFIHIREDVAGAEAIAGVVLDFATPIRGLGAYFSGMGSDIGEVHVTFNDGTGRGIVLTRNETGTGPGGVEYLGFMHADLELSSVILAVHPVNGVVVDEFGVDDLTFISVPEPHGAAIVAAVAAMVWRGRRAARCG